jgi:hypothetical protein
MFSGFLFVFFSSVLRTGEPVPKSAACFAFSVSYSSGRIRLLRVHICF